MNQSIDFLNAIDEFQKKKIPEAVLTRAKQSLLDYLAVCTAGADFQKEKIKRYMAFIMPENGAFRAIGMERRLALKEAVFLNGLNSHALDFDDGTNSGIIHLGSPIFSLLLPLAELYDLSVEAVLKAAVIGYETAYTMAVSIQPGHKAMGYHATGTCGILGASIAASYMLGFTDEERFQAFAAACVSASGMLKVLDDESELKPYNVAKTALLALTSIHLAKAGFKGHHDPLGGRGFIKMMIGSDKVELKPVLLNGTYAIMKTYTKPYASCRYTHPSVEAAIHLKSQIQAEEVERIDIKTYSLAVAGHDHTDIPGPYSAKMSIPYATAAGLIYGKAGLQEFSEESIRGKSILALTKKIHVESDDGLSAAFPGIQASIVRITKTDGTVLTERVDYPKGEPENPLNDAEFKDRYDGLMEYANQTHGGEIYRSICSDGTKVQKVMELM
ncbi:MmgE/PrpD family protein [Hungatella hathewayi]|uniref:MmgE/PrpD family protein n=1 Tax=Hungatella hathewayi TaxID=154046 RepID=UPI0035674BEE